MSRKPRGSGKLQLISNILMIFIVLVVMLSAMIKSFVSPDYINENENRSSKILGAPTFSGFVDGTYQSDTETALIDQFPLSENLKKSYNDVTRTITLSALWPLAENNPDEYVAFEDMALFGKNKYLVYYTYSLFYSGDSMKKRAEDIKKAIERNSDTDFYIYYIEKDTDIVFDTNQKNGAYELIRDNVGISPERISRFEIDSFEKFAKYFYRTDHHWNHLGAYQGYVDVMTLLGRQNVMLPVEELKISSSFSGSKAQSCGAKGILTEDFYAYAFDFIPMEITIDGISAPDYGNAKEFIQNLGKEVSYGEYYGTDSGEIIFSTGNAEKENLLVIGESYDNAILKLLACDFNNTYSIDLRNYSAYAGCEFELDSYIKENDIDKVLLIGNIDYFTGDTFNISK